MKKDNRNDISMVYANDTVDFGTIGICQISDESLDKKDDGTHILSDSDTGDDPSSNSNSNSNSNSKDCLPQHANHNQDTNDDDLYQQHIHYLNTPADATIIDNRKLVYIPVLLACGICAYCSPDVLKHCPMVLRSIQADLSRAFSILPVSVHSLMRRTNLWLNYNGYAYGTNANPRILRHVTTHHHPSWLVEWACDTPQKALGIEIYSCVDFQTMRLHWNGSGLLLHEFCHLIHQCCLEDGLENRTIEALYRTADASGKYEKVLRRDWAGKTRPKSKQAAKTVSVLEEEHQNSEEEEIIIEPADSDLAYAMVDPKEFFAEVSVAYFCTWYRSLDKKNPNIMEACSPPLIHPDATERVECLISQRQRQRQRQKDSGPNTIHHDENSYYPFLGGNNTDYQSIGNGDKSSYYNDNEKDDRCIDCWALFPPLTRFLKHIQGKLPTLLIANHLNNEHEKDPQLAQWQRLTDLVFRETAAIHNCATIGHCNKFYPFTRGQLKQHDPELFHELSSLWREISLWEDPFVSIRTKKKLSRPCSRFHPALFF